MDTIWQHISGDKVKDQQLFRAKVPNVTEAQTRAVQYNLRVVNAKLKRYGFFDDFIPRISAEVLDSMKREFEAAGWEMICARTNLDDSKFRLIVRPAN